MRVYLAYFKDTGKFYSEGSYETPLEEIRDIWEGVRLMQMHGNLPGLSEGPKTHFHVLAEVGGHPRLFPATPRDSSND